MTDNVAELRNEIARSIRSVRLSCFGRKCLKDCVRRMAAAAPHPRATRRRWGAAVAAALLCLGANAQVFCSWVEEYAGIPAHYECTGQGQYIQVSAADQFVVTNMFGGCTNCIDVTPDVCEHLKTSIISACDEISGNPMQGFSGLTEDLRMTVFSLQNTISEKIEDISSFRRFNSGGEFGNVSNSVRDDFTNYVFTVDNTQTGLDRSFSPSTFVLGKVTRWIYYNDGIYDFATQVTLPALRGNSTTLNEIRRKADAIDDRILPLKSLVADNLNCQACSDPGDDGSCGCNDSTGGKWCTEEQGDAITNLLFDTKGFVEKLGAIAISISNNVEIAVQTLHDGFFTSYDHIPTEDDLGMKWQELYLEGYSPNFREYANTNILARIELLLAGMSGVLTNSSDFAEAGDFADDGMQFTNEFDSVVSDFTNQVQNVIEQRERNVRSVGQSLVGLYEAFRGWSGTSFSRETLINSYSVEIGEKHWEVPSFEPSSQGLNVANLIRVVCRSVMSVFYILFTVLIFVRFHIAFFQWVLKYLKWGIELMQGLFA